MGNHTYRCNNRAVTNVQGLDKHHDGVLESTVRRVIWHSMGTLAGAYISRHRKHPEQWNSAAQRWGNPQAQSKVA